MFLCIQHLRRKCYISWSELLIERRQTSHSHCILTAYGRTIFKHKNQIADNSSRQFSCMDTFRIHSHSHWWGFLSPSHSVVASSMASFVQFWRPQKKTCRQWTVGRNLTWLLFILLSSSFLFLFDWRQLLALQKVSNWQSENWEL